MTEIECEIKHSSDYYAKECVIEEIKGLQDHLKEIQFRIDHDRMPLSCEDSLSMYAQNICNAIHELNRIKGL